MYGRVCGVLASALVWATSGKPSTWLPLGDLVDQASHPMRHEIREFEHPRNCKILIRVRQKDDAWGNDAQTGAQAARMQKGVQNVGNSKNVNNMLRNSDLVWPWISLKWSSGFYTWYVYWCGHSSCYSRRNLQTYKPIWRKSRMKPEKSIKWATSGKPSTWLPLGVLVEQATHPVREEISEIQYLKKNQNGNKNSQE